jgi:hypothetical protein
MTINDSQLISDRDILCTGQIFGCTISDQPNFGFRICNFGFMPREGRKVREENSCVSFCGLCGSNNLVFRPPERLDNLFNIFGISPFSRAGIYDFGFEPTTMTTRQPNYLLYFGFEICQQAAASNNSECRFDKSGFHCDVRLASK